MSSNPNGPQSDFQTDEPRLRRATVEDLEPWDSEMLIGGATSDPHHASAAGGGGGTI
jgi:hypothetical protein